LTVLLSHFIPTSYLTILSCVAIAGGLYFFFIGIRPLVDKRSSLNVRPSKIRGAALGLAEVNARVTGPNTMSAPITGQSCFLYRTTAWRQRKGKKKWEKIADETLHVPFLIDDSTGRLLVEPFGTDLDLHLDFHEDYDQPFLVAGSENMPACVSTFLSRHGIASGHRLRIEEQSIKLDDVVFITGTIAENPGVKLHAFTPREGSRSDPADPNAGKINEQINEQYVAPNPLSEAVGAPQIIRLATGAVSPDSHQMDQQAKIVAALTRAGIAKPEAWSAAGVPYPNTAVVDSVVAKAAFSGPADRLPELQVSVGHGSENRASGGSSVRSSVRSADDSTGSAFNLTSPLVMMKGAKDPTFVISFRSQKEFIRALAKKSAPMVSAGAAIVLLGIYTLLAR
jgi:hypothetical protein